MTSPDGWRLVWHDEFEGPAGRSPDPLVWTAQLGGGGWGNGELQTYTGAPENVALDGQGHLIITARATTTGPGERSWTSARISTAGKRTAGHGLFQVRARVPSGVGIWPAAWTLGQNIDQVGWPRCGEIDLIECAGDASTALQTVHGGGRDTRHWQRGVTTQFSIPLSYDFHTYSAEWTTERVVFAVDGEVAGVVRAEDATGSRVWPFDGPHYVLLTVAVGGSLTGPPDASTPTVARMVVDWVRVHSRA